MHNLFTLIAMGFVLFVSAYDERSFQIILDNKQDRTFLLSYPRSGNTWTRYCIEYLTQRPSFNRFNPKHNINFPLGWLADFLIDITKSPVEKVHFKQELKKTGADDAHDALILIIRNPKEALIRHAGKTVLMEVVATNTITQKLQIYFEALEIFDTWHSSKKMMIYYEDLVQNPKETLLKILVFLNEPADRLEEFLNNYQNHKKKCLSLYKVSESAGNDVLYHSKSLSVQERKQIDKWIKEQVPVLWDTYLKDRYSEEFTLHS